MHTKKANNGRRCRSQKKSDSILLSFFDKKSNKKHMNFASRSEGRQDRVRPRFLIKLDMKPGNASSVVRLIVCDDVMKFLD